MQDLIDPISTATGLEPETVRKAVGIVLDFIQKAVPAEASAPVIDGVPGGRAAAAAAEDEAEGGGTAQAGLMGLADRLMAEGVGMGRMQSFGRALFARLAEVVGAGPVEAVVDAIPGLGDML